MQRLPTLLILILFLIIPMACGPKQVTLPTPIEITYQATSVSAAYIDKVNDLVKDAWRNDEITLEQAIEAADLVSKWTHAHNAAVRALDIALKAKDQPGYVVALQLAVIADVIFLQIWKLLDAWGVDTPPLGGES